MSVGCASADPQKKTMMPQLYCGASVLADGLVLSGIKFPAKQDDKKYAIRQWTRPTTMQDNLVFDADMKLLPNPERAYGALNIRDSLNCLEGGPSRVTIAKYCTVESLLNIGIDKDQIFLIYWSGVNPQVSFECMNMHDYACECLALKCLDSNFSSTSWIISKS